MPNHFLPSHVSLPLIYWVPFLRQSFAGHTKFDDIRRSTWSFNCRSCNERREWQSLLIIRDNVTTSCNLYRAMNHIQSFLLNPCATSSSFQEPDWSTSTSRSSKSLAPKPQHLVWASEVESAVAERIDNVLPRTNQAEFSSVWASNAATYDDTVNAGDQADAVREGEAFARRMSHLTRAGKFNVWAENTSGQ